MNTPTSHLPARFVVTLATATLVAACATEAPLAPDGPSTELGLRTADARTDAARSLATLRRVTARYHDLQAASRAGRGA